MKVLEFEILERKYQISCPDKEEEILKACVTLVDSRMKSLKTQGKLHSTEKIAIMVALNSLSDLIRFGIYVSEFRLASGHWLLVTGQQPEARGQRPKR